MKVLKQQDSLFGLQKELWQKNDFVKGSCLAQCYFFIVTNRRPNPSDLERLRLSLYVQADGTVVDGDKLCSDLAASKREVVRLKGFPDCPFRPELPLIVGLDDQNDGVDHFVVAIFSFGRLLLVFDPYRDSKAVKSYEAVDFRQVL